LRGLTLLEMLVTLVILAMVAGILAQALNQLARIERLLEAGQLRSVVVSLRAEWVRNALAAMLPGNTEAERLRGNERDLQALSTEVPGLPDTGVRRMHLRMRSNEATQTTVLELLPEGPAEGEPATLLQWAGTEGRFQYLDAQGRWGDRWPPLSSTGGFALPRAVAVETGRSGAGTLVAAPLAAPDPTPSRAVLEAM
jgi:prepilin-type N-terminal cleavage/methylation domain-containing protein